MNAGRTVPPERTVVVPALVRDYRRLLRLLPFGYRRAHGTETLGHLLEAAAPGQSRPARGDVVDLLRAAAREWVLTPLGSTPTGRRSAIGLLSVVLTALLAVPAAKALGFGSSLAVQDDGRALLPTMLSMVPMAASWAIWALAVAALFAGAGRSARALATAAAGVATMTVVALVAVGQGHAAFLEAGWAVGIAAHALVIAEDAHVHGTGRRRRRRTVTVVAIVVAVGGYLLATAADTSRLGLPWWSSMAATTWSIQAVVVLLAPLGAVAILAPRTRQALPVLVGVATGVLLGRSQLFWSGSLDPSTVDGGNVLGLLAFVLGTTCATRWVVNRIDELAEVRGRLRRDAARTVATGTSVV